MQLPFCRAILHPMTSRSNVLTDMGKSLLIDTMLLRQDAGTLGPAAAALVRGLWPYSGDCCAVCGIGSLAWPTLIL